uniref:Uncharacterized protein n=1 Tax=Oryza meridionalis TaxID=40149 RepID=A0A0E0EDC3_9ORYZ
MAAVALCGRLAADAPTRGVRPVWFLLDRRRRDGESSRAFFSVSLVFGVVIWLKMEVAASIQALPLALGFSLHEFRYCEVARLLGLHAAIRKCFAPVSR